MRSCRLISCALRIFVTERRKRRNSRNCTTGRGRVSATVSFSYWRYFRKKQAENLLMRENLSPFVQEFGSLSKMTSLLSFVSVTPHINCRHRSDLFFQPSYHPKMHRFRCNGETPRSNSTTTQESESQNALLKVAWYGSELLGIAASFFRAPSTVEAPGRDIELAEDGSGAVDRTAVVETVKQDFQRSYFVTGLLILGLTFSFVWLERKLQKRNWSWKLPKLKMSLAIIWIVVIYCLVTE